MSNKDTRLNGCKTRSGAKICRKTKWQKFRFSQIAISFSQTKPILQLIKLPDDSCDYFSILKISNNSHDYFTILEISNTWRRAI